jgi:hypothetical protein
MRWLRAAGGFALAGLALTACSSGGERIEPNDHSTDTSQKVAEAPEVESVITDLFTAIEEHDTDRLDELVPDYDDVDVQVPDVGPELVEIGEITGNTGHFDGASATVHVTYSLAGEEASWDAQLRYVSSGSDDPAWQLTNAIVEVETPSSGGSGPFAEYEVVPQQDGIELDDKIDSLPGAYLYTVTPPTDAFEVTTDAEQVPVFVGDRENEAPPTREEIASAASIELSSAGIDLVSGKYADDVNMCSGWCSEPANDKWQAMVWSQAVDGTGIFTITTGPGASSVTPVDRDNPGDWESAIAEQGDAAAQYAEVSPLSIDYSKVTCSSASASSCSVSQSDGLPSTRDAVRLLYRVGTDGSVTLADVAGNT